MIAKFRPFIIFLILLTFYNFNVDEMQVLRDENKIKDWSFLEGKWKWKEAKGNTFFSVEFKITGDFIYGSYCSTYYEGKKIDCGFDYSFKTKASEEPFLVAKIRSGFSAKNGMVKITSEEPGIIIWELIRPMEGEYYCPEHASLTKQ